MIVQSQEARKKSHISDDLNKALRMLDGSASQLSSWGFHTAEINIHYAIREVVRGMQNLWDDDA